MAVLRNIYVNFKTCFSLSTFVQYVAFPFLWIVNWCQLHKFMVVTRNLTILERFVFIYIWNGIFHLYSVKGRGGSPISVHMVHQLVCIWEGVLKIWYVLTCIFYLKMMMSDNFVVAYYHPGKRARHSKELLKPKQIKSQRCFFFVEGVRCGVNFLEVCAHWLVYEEDWYFNLKG